MSFTKTFVIRVFYENFRKAKGVVYTSDYVLDETLTLLFKRMPFEQAKKFMEHLDAAIQTGYLHLELVTADRFEKAKELRLKYKDKPDISFTDLTSVVIMQELKISRILTEDEHFIQVGMNFELAP